MKVSLFTADELLAKVKELPSIISFQNISNQSVLRQLADSSDDIIWISTDDEKIYINPVFSKTAEWCCETSLSNLSIEEKDLLAEMLDIAPNSITIHDFLGNFIYANKSTFDLYGYSQEEFMALNLHDLDVSEEPDFINTKMQLIRENGSAQFETICIKKDGDKTPIEILVKSVDWKGIPSILSIAKNISERKRMLQELGDAHWATEQSKQFYKLTFEEAAVGIAHVYPNGQVFKVNSKFCSIIGYSAEELSNMTFRDVTHPEDLEIELNYIEKVLAGEIDSFSLEKRYFHKNGTTIWVLLHSSVVRSSEGVIEFAICTISDITESKNLHFELLKSKEDLQIAKEIAEKANQLKTEFLNNMSHEVRTPMNGIIGFADMLIDPDITEEERKYYAQIIQNSSHQLLRIIDDILEISILETKQKNIIEVPFLLNDLMMELYSIFNLKAKERGIPLYIKKALTDNESEIVSDKVKLTKILGNLLENAFKFTSQGFVELGYYINENDLVLYVKDTGIGISQQNHEMIFDRFSQEDKDMSRKYGGLGLGLCISKENAKLLGGTITLKSEKEKGSTFYVTLPARNIQFKTLSIFDASTDTLNTAPKKTYTVLIAEDEELNYLFVEVLFKKMTDDNYNLIHARDGQEAVDACMENKMIDLVLMDIKMPRLNGHEAALKIKAIYPTLPIIAQTAYSTEADKKLALDNGCDEFITKPIQRGQLIDLITRYLHTK